MKKLINLISEEVTKAFVSAGYDEKYGKVTLSNRPDLCEFQCNGAMAAAKEYKCAPFMISDKVAALLESDEMFESVESVKPGFLNIKMDTDCTLKILPGVYQMVDGEININSIRNVDVLDLLGRDPIKVDIDSIMGYVKDKVIMVTGGGGSIGSELCRQIAALQPKKLVILDIYENTTYSLQLELQKKYPELDLTVLIGSVRNTHRVDTIFHCLYAFCRKT